MFSHTSEGCGIWYTALSKLSFFDVFIQPSTIYPILWQGGFIVDAIKWNFTKFLVNKEGQAIKRFGPKENPDSMEPDIKAALGL